MYMMSTVFPIGTGCLTAVQRLLIQASSCVVWETTQICQNIFFDHIMALPATTSVQSSAYMSLENCQPIRAWGVTEGEPGQPADNLH